MSLFKSKRERIRFLKFAFVGVTGTIVDFGGMNLMRIVVGLPLIWSQAISFFVAVINNFLWNRYWTYPDSRSKTPYRQLLQFFLINLVGILVRTPLVAWFDRLILNFLDENRLTLPLDNYIISQNVALTGAIAIVLLWNFFANRYWTYSDVPKEDAPSAAENASTGNQEQG